MRGVLKAGAAFALAAALAGCATSSEEQAALEAEEVPAIKDPKIVVADQSTPIVYVPVIVFRSTTSDKMMRDTYAAFPSLDQCEKAARRGAATPRPSEYDAMAIYEVSCFEVVKDGGQKKIVVETAPPPGVAQTPGGGGTQAPAPAQAQTPATPTPAKKPTPSASQTSS